MITFPNAKINLGLNILSKREDGYHNISSCFVPIGWKDALEAVPSDTFEFTSTGLSIPGDPNDNLCVKAYQLLKKEFDISPVKMHLHKVIPMGAGLGGGSADGAFALKLFNELFELNLSSTKLEFLAQKLGADCPFFIQNRPKHVSGIGDVFEGMDVNLDDYKIVTVFPNIHVDTKNAFSEIVPQIPKKAIQDILEQPINTWQQELINDFEKPVFDQNHQLASIKNSLIEHGAQYASMTGSGSAIYGIFKNDEDAEVIRSGFEDYLVFVH